MDQVVRIHPKALDLLAHMVHSRVIGDVIKQIGIPASDEIAAEVLADALGYALAMCALRKADQSALDQIAARTPEYYKKTLAPFLKRMES